MHSEISTSVQLPSDWQHASGSNSQTVSAHVVPTPLNLPEHELLDSTVQLVPKQQAPASREGR